MKTKTLACALLLAATTADAERVPCDVQTPTSDYSFICSYGSSGNYSQINPELAVLSSNLEDAGLCGPTAISAALDQILDRTNAVAGSWIATNFEPMSRKTRIVNVAHAVGWIDGWGTGESGMDWFQNHAKDIDPLATGHKDFAYWTMFAPQTYFTDTYFRSHLQQGEAIVLHRVKLDENCANDWWGNKQCNYSDDPDSRPHLQAVNGTLTRASDGAWMTRLWQSHDATHPDTAVSQDRDFRVMPINGTDDHRPYGGYTVYFRLEAGGVYSIVDRVHRIATH